jgi:hypothetical protein
LLQYPTRLSLDTGLLGVIHLFGGFVSQWNEAFTGGCLIKLPLGMAEREGRSSCLGNGKIEFFGNFAKNKQEYCGKETLRISIKKYNT